MNPRDLSLARCGTGKPALFPAIIGLVFALLASDAALARTYYVTSVARFNDAMALAVPGDVIAIGTGTYADWQLIVPAQAAGVSGRMIRIRPATAGGVTFKGASTIEILGRYIEVSGFIFDGTGAPSVSVAGAFNRLTGLQFRAAGDALRTYAPIVVIGSGASDNKIDHCLFVGSLSISVQLRSPSDTATILPLRNRIEHNEFQDITRISDNGQEAIQIGQGPGSAHRLLTRIHYNRFVRANGDDEIMSIKSSGNVIGYNFAMDSDGAISLRSGNNNLVEGNVLLRTKRGIIVTGSGQIVINNFVNEPVLEGIMLSIGSDRYRAAVDSIVAHNTVANSRKPLRFVLRDPVETESPRNNKIVNNILAAVRPTDDVVGANGQIPVATYLVSNDLERNVLWWHEGLADLAEAESYRKLGNIVADPLLNLADATVPRLLSGSPALDRALPGYATADMFGTVRPAASPDIGALEVSGP